VGGWSRSSPRPFRLGGALAVGRAIWLPVVGCSRSSPRPWCPAALASAPPGLLGGWSIGAPCRSGAGAVWRCPLRWGAGAGGARHQVLACVTWRRACRSGWVPLRKLCTSRYRKKKVAPGAPDLHLTSPPGKKTLARTDAGPHRRPPPTAQDNARRPRPRPAGGANAPTAAQPRKSRSQRREPKGARGTARPATTQPAHRHRRKGADEPAAGPPRATPYRAGRYSISRSSPTAPTGTNPALR
jgi:hypothetical protein